MQSDDDAKNFRMSLETALKDANEPEAARNSLAFLFPKAEEALRTFLPSGAADYWHRWRRRRISVPDFTQAYFRMNPQRATWARSELSEILDQENPGIAFRMVGERLRTALDQDKPRLRRLFLDALRAFFNEHPITEAWLAAIVDGSPEYISAEDETPAFLFVDDNADRLRRTIFEGLRPLSNAERACLFLKVIPTSTDLSLIADAVRTITGDNRPDSAERHPPLEMSFGEHTATVRDLLLSSAREFAATGKLWHQVQPDRILWFWWGADTGDEVREFTTQALKTEHGIRVLLKIPVRLVRSTAGNYEQVAEWWSKILDIDRLAEIARNWLSDPSLSDQDRALARRYITAYERKEP